MIYITIERDHKARASREGARFRVKVYSHGKALLSSSRALQSVDKASREAEEIFGPLVWGRSVTREEMEALSPDVRLCTVLDQAAAPSGPI